MDAIKNHDQFLDVGNPHTQLEELTNEEIRDIQYELRLELERIYDRYAIEFELEYSDIEEVFAEFT